MTTFTDIANEIIAETGLDDISIVVYTYLYDAVRAICGARENWDFLRVSESFQPPTYHTMTVSLTDWIPSVRNVESFSVRDRGYAISVSDGTGYTGTGHYKFPVYVSPDIFDEQHLTQASRDSNGNINSYGMPTVYTIEATGLGSGQTMVPGKRSLIWLPSTDHAYQMVLIYFMEHPTGASETIYIPNTELVKAAVKIRLYSDRGYVEGAQLQATMYKLGLQDLITRYSGVETQSRNRVKRYF